jgi:hypothetical protein
MHKTIRYILILLFLCSGVELVRAQTAPPSDIYLEELRGWLKVNWFDDFHESLGYNEARKQMYGYIDNSDGLIECVYTGFTQEGGYVTYPDPINAEHLIPQSFFGSSEPMKSDIYILKPCHGSANSARSNIPFGEVIDSQAQWYGVVGNTYTSQGNLPVDEEFWSEKSGGIWEPREEHKGNIARSVFYFYTVYPGIGGISDLGDTETLYQWHLDDPVDAEEEDRNDKIELQQGNRNPYVDYPGLVYDAWFHEEAAVDTDSPEITGEEYITLECSEYPSDEIFITVTDESLPINIVYTDSGSPEGCDAFITRIYTAIDAAGNTSSFAQILHLVDFAPPIFTYIPDDMVIECGEENDDLGEPTVVDNCSAVTITTASTQVGGPCPEGYQIIRMFTAVDECGNASTATQTIIVNETIDPVGCAADLDSDGYITVADILLALGEFGCNSGCNYGVDSDGIVGVSDILEILSQFGEAC